MESLDEDGSFEEESVDEGDQEEDPDLAALSAPIPKGPATRSLQPLGSLGGEDPRSLPPSLAASLPPCLLAVLMPLASLPCTPGMQ